MPHQQTKMNEPKKQLLGRLRIFVKQMKKIRQPLMLKYKYPYINPSRVWKHSAWLSLRYYNDKIASENGNTEQHMSRLIHSTVSDDIWWKISYIWCSIKAFAIIYFMYSYFISLAGTQLRWDKNNTTNYKHENWHQFLWKAKWFVTYMSLILSFMLI